jgi:UDP-N-acetylmuramoyl-tripeptide--D-alanyl-D-alanine ligase
VHLTLGKLLWIGYNLVFVALASIWRRLLFRTTFIAVSGSVGKSTAAHCLVRILSRHYPTVGQVGSNGRRGVPRGLLRARPWHRFMVSEVGILKPGRMWRSAWVVRPDIAVITRVDRQHMLGFGSIETIAEEKSKLLRRLSKNGLAVLNGDDPRVAAMARVGDFRVCRFGTSPSMDVWAGEVSGTWPQRMRLRIHSGAESYWLQTNLVGTHWTPSVLAAIATAMRCGVSLRDAVEALQGIEPHTARLEPVEIPGGAVILRDEYNGSVSSYRKALEILKRARARRRVVVFSRVAEAEGGRVEGARMIGREVATAAEFAVFVGPEAGQAARAAIAAGMSPAEVYCFPVLKDAADFVGNEIRAGDLVLLKGHWNDHLSRIYFAQRGTVECWKIDCWRTGICDECPDLGFQSWFAPADTVKRGPSVVASPLDAALESPHWTSAIGSGTRSRLET